MPEKTMWMVRAEEGGYLFEEFRSGSFVSIGWVKMGDMSDLKTRGQFTKAVEAAYPGQRKMQVAVSAGQTFRFDEPFYWISPSGRERVLLWVQGKGYAWFHTGFDYAGRMKNKLTPGRVRRYLRSLERSGYPYGTVIIRYTIAARITVRRMNISARLSKSGMPVLTISS